MQSIAEALESAIKQHETTETAPEVTPEVAPEVAPEVTKEPRARSEDGKFAKKEPEVTPEAEPAPRKAPSSWKPAAQEAFLKADRGEPLTTEEIKLLTQEAERRESDFHKGVSEFKSHSIGPE